jgi:dTDP-4-dehydrorhamnose reductase
MAAPLLILGRNGQVARELERLAVEREIPAVLAGRERCDLAAGADPGLLVETLRPAAVINAAAYTAVDRAESEVEAAFRLNRDVPARLAEVCAREDIPLVHYSTDYVFDGFKPSPYLEDDARAPRNVYGASKAAGEEAVLTAGARALVLRTAWVFSAFGANFLKTMLRLGAERDELRVVADQHGQPTWARDAAAAGLAGARHLQHGAAAPGVLHAAGADETTWAGFAEAVMDGSRARGGRVAAVTQIATADYPTAAVRPANSRLSTRRIAEVLDWRATPLSQAIEACLDDLEHTR